MTNEDLERAIDFLLKSQANMEAQSARTDDQLKQLAGRLDSFADIQASIMRVLTQNLETQARINESLRAADLRQARFSVSLGETLRASDESLRSAMTELATKQGRTEATVDRLSQKVEVLVRIVEEGRGSH